jgi:EAL domain-containing protein (putative c-di-GMP-specific phosphodiesterase class I)
MLEQNEVLMNLAHRMGERLCVEVTERSMVANFELASKALQRLRELGVKVFLDDFGTGYSSLSYLHKLPVDTLKIDQSFIRNLSANTPEESLVRTIAALAASLDLDVIAEGVETFEQQGQLQALGLQKAQGYLYGKPELRELPMLG